MERFLFLDFETIGLNYREDEPTEIAFIITDSKGKVEEEYSQLIKLPRWKQVPEFITELTGITTELLETEGKHLGEVKQEVQRIIQGDEVVVAHHASFDLGYLSYYFGIQPDKFLCTRHMWHTMEQNRRAGLEAVYRRNIGEITQDHRALNDVYMLRDIFFKWEEVGNKPKEEFYNVLSRVNGRELPFIPKNLIEIV